jgi:hypothetical protein
MPDFDHHAIGEFDLHLVRAVFQSQNAKRFAARAAWAAMDGCISARAGIHQAPSTQMD